MYPMKISNLAAAGLFFLLAPGAARAPEKDRAKRLCKKKIHDAYSVTDFRHVCG